MQESSPAITDFPAGLLRTEETAGSSRKWVEGLDEVLELCYAESLLPSEAGVEWARPCRVLKL